MPAQTRGFLFSDLRGYSAYVERHGDRAARELLTRYRRIVRDVIGHFGGAEVRTEGDSFYVVFASVGQSVEAAIAVQKALAADTDGEPIRAGIGIHAGEVEDDPEQGIVSGAVNIAARICAIADPGEVLVSDTVRGLTRGYLGVTFVPRGRRKLKGIIDPVPVYAVTQEQAGHVSRFRRHSVATAALGAAVVALAVWGMAAAGVGRDPGTTGSASMAATGTSPVDVSSARSMPSPQPPPSAGSPAPTFPDAEQAANLRLVAPDRRASCAPADAEDAPRFRDARGLAFGEPAPFAPLPTVGGIECRLGGVTAPDTVWIWTVAGFGTVNQGVAPGTPEEWMLSHAGQLTASDGTCGPDSGPTRERWSFSGRSGMLLCYETTTGDAIIYWTYDHHDGALGRAVRDDRDMAALLDWWRAEARARD